MTIAQVTLQPGEFHEWHSLPEVSSKGRVDVLSGGVSRSLQLAEGTAGVHTGVVADINGLRAIDTNDLQIALARAAKDCQRDDYACVARNTFGGVPTRFVQTLFRKLWLSWDHYSQCHLEAPSPVIETVTTRTGHTLEVFRKDPLVASVRRFLSEEECGELVWRHADMRALTAAHIGSSGKTVASLTRETLTTNMFVNWDVEDMLSTSAARMFDLASDLLDEDVNYEGQEPINLLHYLPGYEYQPHADGGGGRTKPSRGKRVGTSLVYCEAPAEGGSTVFVSGRRVKFQPRPGDLLFFSYNPDPAWEGRHAACPVIEGNKTTLTQWYRFGTSAANNWDQYEDWGKFHNPHLRSVWQGPRFSVSEKMDL